MPGLQKALERIIPRGERRLVPMGLGVLLLLIAAMLSSMWWAGDSQRHILQARRQSEITGVAVTLAEAVKPFLAKDDLAPLRRLFLETREAFALSDCRLRLPDGRVIADGEPSRITAATLPARWGTGPLDAQLSAPTSGDAFVNAAIPVLIPSRGLVTVEIAGPVSYPAWSTSEMEAGLSLIGAACVGGSLMLYRRLRSRGATLELIHESLAAAAGGGVLLAEHRKRRNIAFAIPALLLLAGYGQFLVWDLPALDRAVSARTIWYDDLSRRENPSVSNQNRTLRYGICYYANGQLADCPDN